MEIRTTPLAVTICFLGALTCFAADNPQLGSWKLNGGKSKIAAGMPKVHISVYEAAGGSIKVTTDGEEF